MSDNPKLPVELNVSDVFGLGKLANSPAVARLVDGAMTGIGTVYSGTLGPWMENRRVDAALQSASKVAKNFPSTKIFNLSIADRSVMRLQHEQEFKQLNREEIAFEAIEISSTNYIETEANSAPEHNIDERWLSEFWAGAENCTDANFRSLWARVLSKKALEQKSTSIRTLQRLLSLEKEELDQIQQMAPIAVQFNSPREEEVPSSRGILLSLGQYQGTLPVNDEINERLSAYVTSRIRGIDKTSMDSAGVMLSSNGWAAEFSVAYSTSVQIQIGNKSFTLDGLPEPNERYIASYNLGSGFGITKEGWEIMAVANCSPDRNYIKLVRDALELSGARLLEA